jgi:hypothetical protein
VAQAGEAAHRALETLAARVREEERERREHDLRAQRSLERLQRRHRESDEHRKRTGRASHPGNGSTGRSRSSVWSRRRVPLRSGGRRRAAERPELTRHGDPASEARYVALRAAREVEALLDAHKRRDVQRAA